MVLEATVICLDNSEWMRNGDYTPSRLEAQQDAINLITGAKTQSNPENTVGVIACAGRSPELLVSLTADLGKVLTSLHNLKIQANLDFVAGIQVAQLALKHRQNKNQHQRIIFFVGSPITATTDDLVKLAKRLKKNNVAVDVVNFGEEATNTDKLEAFRNAANNNDNSHLITIPPGPHILSDILISSPIVSADSGAASVAAGTSAAASGDFAGLGVDPNLDPELALALKVSMEEERARQALRSSEGASQSSPAPTTSSTPAATSTDTSMVEAEDEQELLQQAIAMSMSQLTGAAPTTTSTTATTSTSAGPSISVPKPESSTPAHAPTTTVKTDAKDTSMMEVDEDEEMRLAMQMSLQADREKTEKQAQQQPQQATTDINKIIEDPNFVNQVLMSLPGVDPNDDRIKSVLASLTGEKKEDKEKEKDKDKKQ